MSASTAPTTKLDDLMLAMDVVDTIRHKEDVLQRELSLGDRDEELIARLREIYTSQGITVTDAILKEGVKALKEQRFQYKAPPGGLTTAMFGLWVRRGALTKWLAAILIVLGLGWYANSAGWFSPDQARIERDRAELQQVLPDGLKKAANAASAASKDPEADRRIAAFLAAGEAGIADQNAGAVRKAIADLDGIRAELIRTYDLVIVSRPDERTGVFRIFDSQPGVRNYYIIVEAIGPDGSKQSLPIRSEEDQSLNTVSIFGVRVPKATYDKVGRDKQQDGIVQDNLLGRKEAGKLSPTYIMSAEGGMITSW